jgi:hypothetical protein
MNSIEISYMYRDEGNWKTHGEKVFSNKNLLDTIDIENRIRERMISETYFYPESWAFMPLDGNIFFPSPQFHEITSVKAINLNEPPREDILDFLGVIKSNDLINL